MDPIIFRIAPSPSKADGKDKSGLHLGNVRTAAFNYLMAKKLGGHFLYRVEDSNQDKCSKTGADDLLDELNWLNMSPTQGYGTTNKPVEHYTQMERLPIYKKYIDVLLEKGLAYKCYCTADSLEKAREEALAKNPKAPFKYPGICRTADQNQQKDYVIRFKAPIDGVIEFEDLVFGKRSFPNKENYDFVIARSNGVALFVLANAIDDFFIDRVSHIVRGRDHQSNTPYQILIGQALGAKIPVYAHLSMILGSPDESGKAAKLSKRDGAVSIAEFKEAGYAPGAILNYLVRLGWSYGNQEIFSLDELIEKFDLKSINKADAKFDYKKFAAINFEHLKSEKLVPDDEYAKHLKPFLDRDGFKLSIEEIIPFVKVVRSRGKTFLESAFLLSPMLKETVSISNELISKLDKTTIAGLFSLYQKIDQWTEESIKRTMTGFFEAEGLTLKDVGASLRIALLGQTNSPDLYAVLAAMGRGRVLARLAAAGDAQGERATQDRVDVFQSQV